MVKYRNVTVNMKGGKTRIQRAMVLASGKLKFVKNIGHHRSASKGAKPHKTKRRKIYMTRKKRGHNRGSLTQGVERIVKVGALLAPAAEAALSQGTSTTQKLQVIGRRYTGYDFVQGRYSLHWLAEGWAPFVGVSLASIAVHKILGLLRRI